MTDSAPYIIYDFDQTAKVFNRSSFNAFMDDDSHAIAELTFLLFALAFS
jgi:hypothetical protein